MISFIIDDSSEVEWGRYDLPRWLELPMVHQWYVFLCKLQGIGPCSQNLGNAKEVTEKECTIFMIFVGDKTEQNMEQLLCLTCQTNHRKTYGNIIQTMAEKECQWSVESED